MLKNSGTRTHTNTHTHIHTHTHTHTHIHKHTHTHTHTHKHTHICIPINFLEKSNLKGMHWPSEPAWFEVTSIHKKCEQNH